MQKLFTLPDALCRFIQALPITPPQQDPPSKPWPTDSISHPESTTKHAHHLSREWLAARDAYVSHIMTCRRCVTSGVKTPRYCQGGEALWQSYLDANNHLNK